MFYTWKEEYLSSFFVFIKGGSMVNGRLFAKGQVGVIVVLFLSIILVGQTASVQAQTSPDTIFAVTTANRLIQFSSANPGIIAAQRPITGIPSGEQILGIDFRPANGSLFALGSSNRLYTINPTSGAATMVGTQPFTSTAIGSAFGFDFNPMVDRIRLVSDSRVNLRLNPNNGAVAAADGRITYASGDPNATVTPQVVGAGYTNNISGTTSTQLFVIDTANDVLALQGSAGPPVVSPNTGQLFTVGALGVEAGDQVGFDITPAGNAYVSITSPTTTTTSFGTINLTTGAVNVVGPIAGGASVRDIAVATKALPLPQAEPVYAVTSSNKLLQFISSTPGTIASSVALTGLVANEQIVGIDFRPATGALLALGSTNRLYTVDTSTGAASVIGTQPFTSTVIGSAFGFDFNPVVDRIRLVSDSRVNLRLNPITGGVAATDTQLSYASSDANAGDIPQAVAAGYTNNISGTTSTQLYVIDTANDVLALQGRSGTPAVSPNSGQLFTVGALGVELGEQVGFDITPAGAAYVSNTGPSGGNSTFGTIDLATGAFTSIGVIGGGETIRDIALAAGPVVSAPYKVWLPIVVKE